MSEYMPDYDQLGREVKQLEDSNEWLQQRLDEMDAIIGRLILANKRLREEIAALKGEE